MEQRGQPDAQRHAGVGSRLDDLEEMLVEGEIVEAALLLEAERRAELGEDLDERAGVAGEPECPRRLGAEQELRQLAEPVAREPAADPLGGDVLEPGRPLAHLRLGHGIEVEPELRDEAQAPDDPERVVAERGRPCRPQQPAREVCLPAEGIE